MVKDGELDVELSFVVGEKVVGGADQIGLSDGMVCECGWGCSELLKLCVQNVSGRWSGIVEVFDGLVVIVCRDVGYPGGREAKESMFFIGYGACGGKWCGGKLKEVVNGERPPFIELA